MMPSYHSHSSKHSGLRPSTLLSPPSSQVPAVVQPTPSLQPQVPVSEAEDIASCHDDLSLASVEPSSHTIGLLIKPCPDYACLSTWMSQTFPHHFGIKEVFFINQV